MTTDTMPKGLMLSVVFNHRVNEGWVVAEHILFKFTVIVLRGTVLKSVTVTRVPTLGFDCF